MEEPTWINEGTLDLRQRMLEAKDPAPTLGGCVTPDGYKIWTHFRGPRGPHIYISWSEEEGEFVIRRDRESGDGKLSTMVVAWVKP